MLLCNKGIGPLFVSIWLFFITNHQDIISIDVVSDISYQIFSWYPSTNKYFILRSFQSSSRRHLSSISDSSGIHLLYRSLPQNLTQLIHYRHYHDYDSFLLASCLTDSIFVLYLFTLPSKHWSYIWKLSTKRPLFLSTFTSWCFMASFLFSCC